MTSRLPNADSAIVDLAKITEYLLNDAHPQGSAKSRFLKLFGFKLDRPDELERALLAHARAHPISRIRSSLFGPKFEVSGPMAAPDGRLLHVRTVWIIRLGDANPAFVTLKPLRR